MRSAEITIHVQRFNPQTDEAPTMRSYVVPYEEGMSLLDCLVKIRELYDPSLAFLYSCRYDNSCKLCLASVNGRVSYLCLTPAEDGTQIRPVPKGKIIRDLVTNIRTMT